MVQHVATYFIENCQLSQLFSKQYSGSAIPCISAHSFFGPTSQRTWHTFFYLWWIPWYQAFPKRHIKSNIRLLNISHSMNITVLSGRIRFNHQTFFHHNIKIDDIAPMTNEQLVSVASDGHETEVIHPTFLDLLDHNPPLFYVEKRCHVSSDSYEWLLASRILYVLFTKKWRTKTLNLQAENPNEPWDLGWFGGTQ